MAWVKTLAFIVLSPLLGMAVGWALMIGVSWIFHTRRTARSTAGSGGRSSGRPPRSRCRTAPTTRRRRWASSRGCSSPTSTTSRTRRRRFHWMHLPDLKADPALDHPVGARGDRLGTLTGGWRIVRTMGSRITKLKPFSGFCAETGAAATVIAASVWGIPVSTTHTITGAIVGRGRRRSGSPRCAGESRAGSSTPGSSRSRWPRRSARSGTPSSRRSRTESRGSRGNAWSGHGIPRSRPIRKDRPKKRSPPSHSGGSKEEICVPARITEEAGCLLRPDLCRGRRSRSVYF